MDDPRDQLHIRELRLRCIIGIYPEERRAAQDVEINITLYADLRRACQSDDFADTVDYKAVKKRVVAFVEASEFGLIERLAQGIADLCLEAPRRHRCSGDRRQTGGPPLRAQCGGGHHPRAPDSCLSSPPGPLSPWPPTSPPRRTSPRRWRPSRQPCPSKRYPRSTYAPLGRPEQGDDYNGALRVRHRGGARHLRLDPAAH